MLAHAAPAGGGWLPWRDIPGSQGLQAPALGGEGVSLLLVALGAGG